MNLAQILIALWMVITLLVCLHHDFNGRSAREPGGFSGAVTTLIIVALMVAILYKAGAFSTLL